MGRFIAGMIACALGLGSLAAGPSAAMTYAEWKKSSEAFRSGFAWGIAESLVFFSNSDAEKIISGAYRKCFQENKFDSIMTLRTVEAYLQRTPEAAATPMAANVLRSYVEACKTYLDATATE